MTLKRFFSLHSKFEAHVCTFPPFNSLIICCKSSEADSRITPHKWAGAADINIAASGLVEEIVLVSSALKGGQEAKARQSIAKQSMAKIGGAATSVTISFDKLFAGNPKPDSHSISILD